MKSHQTREQCRRSKLLTADPLGGDLWDEERGDRAAADRKEHDVQEGAAEHNGGPDRLYVPPPSATNDSQKTASLQGGAGSWGRGGGV